MEGPSPVTVVGSLNIDYIAAVERLPQPGETVAAGKLIRRFGGKGANQAVAADRQGAKVTLLGCVGDDDNGRAYRQRLARENIRATAVATTPKALTGTALIAVDSRGENMIIVAAGANGQFQPATVRRYARLIRSARVLLVQFEVPLATLVEAVRQASMGGVAVVLNPSPWRGGFPWGRWPLDTVIANAPEAQAIFGLKAREFSEKAARLIRRQMGQKKIEHLIITRGGQPTICIGNQTYFEVPTLPVKPVDTVGAGDAFAGAYAAARAEGMDLHRAVRLANAAGALATLKRGAQESMPTRRATWRALRKFKPRG